MMRHWTLLLLWTLFAATVDSVPIQLYGLNYNTRQGPDWDPYKCKSREQVKVELTMLQRVTSRIRILSLADCGQGLIVLDVAKELGLQLWLGLWVSEFDYVFQDEMTVLESMLDQGLLDDTVLGITVGSESIYRKEVTVQENIAYKDQVKALCVAAGRSDLPMSIVDIAPTYQSYPQLTEAVDVIITNSFPFWESVPVENATDYLLDEIQLFTKDFILGETGWPSGGYNAGVGTGSPEGQSEFFQQYFCRMDKELNWKYYYFTGIDSAWRQEQDPNNTIEPNWGMLYANLTLKPHFQDLTFTCPGSSVEYSFSEIDWTIPATSTPVEAPTTNPAPTSQASCSSHYGCKDLGGNCCPTDYGDFLGCCDTTAPQTATNSPPTTSPTKSLAEAPTGSPSKQLVADSPEPTVTPRNPTPEPTEQPTVTPGNPTREPTESPTSSPNSPPTIGAILSNDNFSGATSVKRTVATFVALALGFGLWFVQECS